jgi:hypothetical protein
MYNIHTTPFQEGRRRIIFTSTTSIKGTTKDKKDKS